MGKRSEETVNPNFYAGVYLMKSHDISSFLTFLLFF